MKNILSKKLLYLTLGATMLAPLACNEEFLEVPVTAQVTENAIASVDGVKGLLVGTYSMLNGRGYGRYSGFSNWIWGSVRGGDANKGSDSGDQGTINEVIDYEVQATNENVHQKWQSSFEGVARANQLLFTLQQATELDKDYKDLIAAEARFLRALYYFELKKNFNNVPWVDETTSKVAAEADVEIEEKSNIPNNTDIWPNIEADLKAAYEGLPEKQDEIGRANKWAAGAYLAKAYMFQNKFAEAKALFDVIIESGVTSGGKKYDLVADYGNLFRGEFENSAETVFAFQAAANTGSVLNTNQDYELNFPHTSSTTAPGNCCGFFQPSFELTNSYRTTEEGLPILDGSYNDPELALDTDMGIAADAAFTPDAGPLDPRLDHTVGRRGIPYLDWQVHPGASWIRDQSHGGPYAPKKYIYAKSEIGTYQDGSSWTPGYTSMNFMLMRFADVLLMAAEAEVEVGSLDKALTYVNRVRARAAESVLMNGDVPAANYEVGLYDSFTGKDMAREAVRFERKLELAMEGHRFYDLLRWGVLDVAIPNYIAYEKVLLPKQLGDAKWDSGKDEYLPIPQRQIDLVGGDILTQNPGY